MITYNLGVEMGTKHLIYVCPLLPNETPDKIDSIHDVGEFIDSGYARGKTLFASSKHDALCYYTRELGKAYGVDVLDFFDGVDYTVDEYQIRVIRNNVLFLIRDGLVKVIRGIEENPQIAGSVIKKDYEWVLKKVKDANASLDADMPEGCEYFYLFVYLKSILAIVNTAISENCHCLFVKSFG